MRDFFLQASGRRKERGCLVMAATFPAARLGTSHPYTCSVTPVRLHVNQRHCLSTALQPQRLTHTCADSQAAHVTSITFSSSSPHPSRE